MDALNVRTASAAELLAFYNQHAGKPVRRFADRPTAERRCRELAATLTFLSTQAPTEQPEMLNKPYRVGVCPKCGAHEDITCGQVRTLRNGLQEVINEHEAFCHPCGHEFNYATGEPVKRRKRTHALTRTAPRPVMRESLKLDRRIRHLDTNTVYANACRVWKAGLVSSSQGDRLSAFLYAAAKRNEFPVANVNEHRFQLAAATTEE
jgi:hypothetical protein